MGGRSGRRATRAQPLAPADKPVRPGMQGGLYRPLAQRDVERVHAAALDVLENIGLAQPIASCVELVTEAGGRLRDDGRLLFPRALVEDTVASAARNIVLHGQRAEHDMELSGARVYFGTAGAAVHVVDCETRAYRDSTLADLYQIARLVDAFPSQINSIRLGKPSLEDVFIDKTGHRFWRAQQESAVAGGTDR